MSKRGLVLHRTKIRVLSVGALQAARGGMMNDTVPLSQRWSCNCILDVSQVYGTCICPINYTDRAYGCA